MAEPRVSLIPGISELLADKGYDTATRSANSFPGKSNRKRKIRHDKQAYKYRNVIGCCFCGLKDFRRIATRYDSLARNFFSAICFVHPCVLAPI